MARKAHDRDHTDRTAPTRIAIVALGLSLVACTREARTEEQAVHGADHAPHLAHDACRLTVARRVIYPARLEVYRLSGTGECELIELVPPGRELLGVSRGELDGIGSACARLGSAGFFDWRDEDLVPPPGLDVESDLLRVELRDGERVRVLSTREPHVPEALRSILAELDGLERQLSLVEAGTVLVPSLLRTPSSDLPKAAESADWMASLREACSGPFPLALAGRLPPDQRPPREFTVRFQDRPYRVSVLVWP